MFCVTEFSYSEQHSVSTTDVHECFDGLVSIRSIKSGYCVGCFWDLCADASLQLLHESGYVLLFNLAPTLHLLQPDRQSLTKVCNDIFISYTLSLSTTL